MLQGGACSAQTETAAAEGVVDHFFQQGDDAGGVRDTEHAAGGEIKIAHQLRSACAGEIEEVFYHGLLG